MKRIMPWSILVHRWMGLVIVIPAVLWFGSAIVMHVWTESPTPTEEERLRVHDRLEMADLAAVTFPPGETAGEATVQSALLHNVAGRLVWQIQPARARGAASSASSAEGYDDAQAGYDDAQSQSERYDDDVPRMTYGRATVLDAYTGESIDRFTIDEARAIAVKVARSERAPARGAIVTEYSQLYYGNVPLPAYRFSFDDHERTDVYVDPTTGAVTATVGNSARIRRYFGTMPHYFQFTNPGTYWRENLISPARIIMLTVMLLVAAAGLVYGVWLLRVRSRVRRTPASRPRTAKYVVGTVHNWIGIGFLAVVIAWTASGYTMFLWFPSMRPGPEEAARLTERPLDFAEYRVLPDSALAAATAGDERPVSRIRTRRLLDRPVYDVVRYDGSSTLVDGLTGEIMSPLPDSVVMAVATRFLGRKPEIRTLAAVGENDPYHYGTRRRQIRPAIRIDLADGQSPSPFYIDAQSGALLGRVDREYRTFRWVGRALHTFDFPALISRPGLWALAIILPSLFVLLLASTGLWLGGKHLLAVARRRVARAQSAEVRLEQSNAA